MASDGAIQRQNLLNAFREAPSGLEWCRQHTRLCDEIVRGLVGEDGDRYAIIATGGYGREELAPYSDIDITIVPADDANPHVDEAIRKLYRALHSAFTEVGLEVGYAYRLVSDAPGLDSVSRTGLMDMRHIAGRSGLTQSLRRALEESLTSGEFIVEKIRERRQAFAKNHDSPLVTEPNIKEGAGGVRCLHTANWIRQSIGERSAVPTEAFERMLKVRNALHLVSGKRNELLSRSRQNAVAELLSEDPLSLIGNVARDGLVLHGEYTRTLERLQEARFGLASGVLALRGEVRLDGDVNAGQASVGIATATQLGLKVPDVRMVAVGAIEGPAAAYALSTGEATIRNIDRAGLLDALLPELTACRTLDPEEGNHRWTVFEHTMRLVRSIDSLVAGTFLGDLRDSIAEPEALYLAALLHDVGKRDPERDHSLFGSEIATDVGHRWGLGDNVIQDVAWLIREHLTMSRFIRIRDLMHPQTIDEFASVVGDGNRLAMLTVLTWADINAVSEGAWTPAQETFQRLLYDQTAARLHEDWQGPDPNLYRRRLLRQLSQKEAESGFEAFVETLPASYLLANAADTIRLHHHYALQASFGQPTVDFYARPELGASDVTVAAIDRPGLLSDLLGVFYAFDLSVQAIRAITTSDVALDVFTLSYTGRPIPSATAAETQRAALAVLRGERSSAEVMRERGKDPDRHQSIFRFAYTPGQPGVLEIRAPRGRGMAYRLSRLIAEQGWNVSAARVGQWGGNGAAAFYVVGTDGQPIERADVERAMATI
ncbi:HD domain-containing protein [bacterium]|nr:MAG: HD domain-containing protein [bacterium]